MDFERSATGALADALDGMAAEWHSQRESRDAAAVDAWIKQHAPQVVRNLGDYFPDWPNTADTEATRLFAARGDVFFIGPTGRVARHDPDSAGSWEDLGSLSVCDVGGAHSVQAVGVERDGRFLIVVGARGVAVSDLDPAGTRALALRWAPAPGSRIVYGPYLYGRPALVAVTDRAGRAVSWWAVPVAPDVINGPVEILSERPVPLACAGSRDGGVLVLDPQGLHLISGSEPGTKPVQIADADQLARHGMDLGKSTPQASILVDGEDAVVAAPKADEAGGLAVVLVSRFMRAGRQLGGCRVAPQPSLPWAFQSKNGSARFFIVGPERVVFQADDGTVLREIGEGGKAVRPVMAGSWAVYGARMADRSMRVSFVHSGHEGVLPGIPASMVPFFAWRPPQLFFIDADSEGGVALRSITLGPGGAETTS